MGVRLGHLCPHQRALGGPGWALFCATPAQETISWFQISGTGLPLGWVAGPTGAVLVRKHYPTLKKSSRSPMLVPIHPARSTGSRASQPGPLRGWVPSRADPRWPEPMKSNGDVGVSGGAERGEPSGSRAERSRPLNTAPMNTSPSTARSTHQTHTPGIGPDPRGRQPEEDIGNEQREHRANDPTCASGPKGR